jgi:hypothetical protein
MRKSKLGFLIVLSLIMVAVGLTVSSKSHPHTGTSMAVGPQVVPTNSNDLPGTIDGAKNPELIPDAVAYSAIFRLLSNRRTEDEVIKARAYVKQMGLGKHNCRACPPAIDTPESDVDALLAAAEEFYQRISVLDQQVAEIKDRTWPSPTAAIMAQLAGLQQQREAVATQVAASLPTRLTPEGMQRVSKHINEHVKQRLKLVPEPTTPPGGEGWHAAI